MQIKGEYQSKSSPGSKPHVTTYDTDSRTARCSCRGARGSECWHMRDMVAKHSGSAPGDAVAAPVIAETVTASRSFEPMLASAMTKGQQIEHFMTPDWVLEEKYNGWREIVELRRGVVQRSRSRSGKTPKPLPPQVQRALAHMPDGIYDGERVVPGMRSTDVGRDDMQDRVCLVLFDVLELLGEYTVTQPYAVRRELLVLAATHISKADPGCTAVGVSAAQPVSRAAYDAIRAAGGEGAMLKRVTAPYRCGYRSDDWMKVVPGGRAPVTILGFEDGDTGIKCGRTRVVDAAGRTFTLKTTNNAMIRAAQANPAAFEGRRYVISFREQLPSGAYLFPKLDHEAGEGE